jgi:hypothetical protein
MQDQIRELRLGGWSERRIAAELGITRHRVRTALEGFRPPAPVSGATWVDVVDVQLDRARYRQGDDAQLALAELAYDVAEWLDARWEHYKEWEGQVHDLRQLAGSLRYTVQGITEGSNPLVRLHARRTFRLRDLPVPAWLQEETS